MSDGTSNFRYVHSTEFPDFLRSIPATLAVTTYQAGKLITFRARENRLSMLLRTFDKAMGLAVLADRMAIGTEYQVWELRDSKELAAKLISHTQESRQIHDACFIPRSCHVTGNIDVHEMAWGNDPSDPGLANAPTLWIVNTMFSCLCSLDSDFSFVPRWSPPFITQLRRQDRCHLNGMALVNGVPKFVTAFGETDTPEGWRPGKINSGVIIDVESGETVARGFSMPHSPRVHDGRLWVLDSGRGTLCTVDVASGKKEAIVELPGYTRGLVFAGRFAMVGLSKIREKSVFGGVPVAERSGERKCGVWIVDTLTGSIVATLDFQDSVEELFDLQLLYGVRFPAIVGLKKETIRNACVIAPLRSISTSTPTTRASDTGFQFEPSAGGREKAIDHNGRGMSLIRAGRFREAIIELQKAVQLDLAYAKAHNNLGIALRGDGRPEDAVAAYRAATKIDADYAKAWTNLGIVLTELKRYDEAKKVLLRAVDLDPNYANAHFNLGELYLAKNKFAESEACFRDALKIDGENCSAIIGLSRCSMQQYRFEEASGLLENALKRHPEDPTIWKSLALIEQECGRFKSAEQRFLKALEFAPGNAIVHFGLALLNLATGEYRRAWPHFEKGYGDNMPDGSQPNAPRWDGSSLVGKSILLHAEQGFGDTIQFARFVAKVKNAATPRRIVLACRQRLVELLKTCPGVDEVIAQESRLPVCDVQLPLMSVPAILNSSLEEIPNTTPYLFAREDLQKRWREQFSNVNGKRIGIVWQGDPSYHRDHHRSLPLSNFAPLAEVPGVSLISLQKGFGREQLAGVDFPILDMGHSLDESTGAFVETAALVKELDLLISSDTSIIHLAGALGVPVWVVLSKTPDWRFLLNREDSPWYPTMRLFRQSEHGRWDDVFACLKLEIASI